MSVYDIPLTTIDGSPLDPGLLHGKATLVVNVASKCGLTPQYEALERLHDRYRESGFTVLGIPCNQFGGQEPGSAEEIATFCSDSYDVSFPLTEKANVNGRSQHPLYRELTPVADAEGLAGDIQWNFEKFLVSPQGEVIARFRPRTLPDAEEIISAIEAVLPGTAPAWTPRPASEVRIGDRVRLESGAELTVTRIEPQFLGNEGLLCLIEDTAAQWLALPVPESAEVTVLAVSSIGRA